MADKIRLEEDEYQDVDKKTTAIGQYCHQLYTEYSGSSYRARKLKEINEGRKRYDNDRPAKDFPFKNSSNKSLGLEAIAVDNLEPRLVNKLIGEDDFIQVKPVAADDIDKIDQVKEFLAWATLQNMKIKKAMKPVCHDLLMDGTKDVLLIWEEKKVINRVRGSQPIFLDQEGNEVELPPGITDQGTPDQVMQTLIAMGLKPGGKKEGFKESAEKDFRVRVEALKIEDCFFPDHNDRWEEQPFIRKITLTLGELQELQEQGVYKNITNSLVRGSQRQTTDDESRKDIQYSLYGQECDLFECFLKWKGEWRLATFADVSWEEVRNQKLQDVYWHGRKPIHRFTIYPKSNESMGTGVPHKIKEFSKGMNDLYNQMIDAGTIDIIPYSYFNQSSTGMVASKKQEIFPGARIPIPKDANVFFPPRSSASRLFIEFITLLLTFYERTLSLMDYSAGTRSASTGQGGDTASGMNMILQEGNIKHNYTGEHVQDTFAEMLTDALSLYAQNIPMDAKIRLFKDNKWLFQEVDIAAIQGKYDIAIDVSDSSTNTMTNRNEKLALLQNFRGAPMVDQTQLAKDVYKAFGIRDTEHRINPAWEMLSQALIQAPEIAQPLQQMVQQFMQQKQQQMRQQELQSQAQANIERQEVQRQAEAPFENRKIVDRANERFKSKIIGKAVEEIGGINEM